MIKRVLDQLPEVKKVRTDCLAGNDIMISINQKLGFNRKKVPHEKEIILDALFLREIGKSGKHE